MTATTQPGAPSRRTERRHDRPRGWVLLFIGCCLMALNAIALLVANADDYLDYRHVLGIHVICALFAIVTAPLQLLGGLRRRRPRLHRIIGRVYVAAVLTGGPAGMVMATMTIGDGREQVANVSFFALGAVWVYTTWQGFRHARAGRYAEHRRWMIRSFALTFSSVTLRIYIITALAIGIPEDVQYAINAWLAWVPNLLVALWLTRRTPTDSPRTESPRTESPRAESPRAECPRTEGAKP